MSKGESQRGHTLMTRVHLCPLPPCDSARFSFPVASLAATSAAKISSTPRMMAPFPHLFRCSTAHVPARRRRRASAEKWESEQNPEMDASCLSLPM